MNLLPTEHRLYSLECKINWLKRAISVLIEEVEEISKSGSIGDMEPIPATENDLNQTAEFIDPQLNIKHSKHPTWKLLADDSFAATGPDGGLFLIRNGRIFSYAWSPLRKGDIYFNSTDALHACGQDWIDLYSEPNNR